MVTHWAEIDALSRGTASLSSEIERLTAEMDAHSRGTARVTTEMTRLASEMDALC